MPTYTTRLGLKRPDGVDPFLRSDFNLNWNMIDTYPGSFICTSGTQPTWGDAQIGMAIYETDTRLEKRWTGTTWHTINPVERMTGEITMFVSGTIPSGWLLCDGTDKPRSTYPTLSTVVADQYGAAATPATHFRLPNLQYRVPIGGGPGVPGPLGAAGTFSARNLGDSGGKEKHILDATEQPLHTHTGSSVGAGAHTPSGSTGFDDRRHAHYQSAETWRNHAGGTHQVFVNTAQNHGSPGSGGYYWMTTDSVGGSGRPATDANNDFNLHAHAVTLTAVGDHTHTINVGNAGSSAAHENMPPFLVVNFLIKT